METKTDLLYHYTTGGALLGMLNDYDKVNNPNLTMWATHCDFMNDPSEYRCEIEQFRKAIVQVEQKLNIPEDRCIGNLLGIDKSESYRIDQERQNATLFIISFSKLKDSLNMWNMYAQNGNGLALVFNEHKINANCKPRYCVYDHTQEKIIQLIRQAYLQYQSLKVHADDLNLSAKEIRQIRASAMATMIYRKTASFLKDKAYQNEKECRIVLDLFGRNMQFRENKGLIVPYVEQQIPFDCLDSIMVGPTADFDRTQEAILLFLNSKGVYWHKDKIIKSEVPYRN